MGSAFQRCAFLALVLATVVAPALRVRAQTDSAQAIVVSFSFPDGSTKSTSVTLTEVEPVTGERPAYTLLPWVLTALRKLELSHDTEADAKGVRITSISGIANSSQGEWLYSANGVPSPYRLNTQTIEGVTHVSFSYRDRAP